MTPCSTQLAVTLQQPADISRTRWVIAQIRRWVSDGDLATGERLPGSVELMTLFGIASTTLSRALETLKEAGEVTTTPAGTFIGSTPPSSTAGQVRAVLCARILDGTYPVGSRIPPMAALATDFGVSGKRIQEAQEPLKAAGVLLAQSTAGTFVTGGALARLAANPALHTLKEDSR